MKTLTDLLETHACQLECFAPAAELHRHTQGLLLPPRLWQILGALGQGAGAAELAPRLGLPVETVHAVLRGLEAEGLVSKVMILNPGMPAQPAPIPMAASAAPGAGQPEMLAVEAAALASLQAESAPAPQPATRAPQAPATVAQPRKGHVTLKFAARSRPAQQAVAPVAMAAPVAPAASANPPSPCVEAPVATRPAPVRLRLGAAQRKAAAPASEPTPAPHQQAWPLQPVLDALRAKTGGDPMVGQLLAYRVFLRVPGELLQAAGIRSVCLIEPDLVIHDPKLKQAIETALQDVAGLSWPAALTQAA